MDYEYEYNPRKSVTNAPELIAGWTGRSRALLARASPLADIAYGMHPREVFDLFRIEGARGTVVYVHGGYWRMLSKYETAWVAEAFIAQGLSVALINYPLCPEVTVADIRASIQQAFAKLWRDVLTLEEKRRVVVAGHSAGGHLAAAHLATDWPRFGLPARPLAGVLAVSGVFDVRPLLHTSMNADIRLTPQSVGPLDLLRTPAACEAPLLLAVGALEPDEFHRQSRDLAAAWPTLQPEVHVIPGANHFTAIDGLAVVGDRLNQWVLDRVAN